ncbi:helix-turn-helix domain-containing protein [Rummeliibacillus sp. POC4]|uniref:helix-turn-helix domain-containing protein n=1 Tax=Rummeliibacillus sp. POC4 TaxID=2305899 RepID=UPI000E675154|nr:helix-turn-helix domain-containing protein [Rummeliibacillus sp. POC4]RIJ66381.1 helix-turn-helix domain-containing protein [Rummeliibacillus sp. POC4]
MKNLISTNLKNLRKRYDYTQEQLAEKLNVSRQVIAKWEKGESLPDIQLCSQLAELFDVALDDLVNYSSKEVGVDVPPRGKHMFGIVTVSERGQIVIPKKAREVFNIQSGAQLIIVGDDERGLGIVPQHYMKKFFQQAFLEEEDDEK